ncbi:MAG: sulfatase family protein [Planctomycetota bacterium]
MNRRSFIRMTGGTIATLAMGRTTFARGTDHPNLLIIQTDEHNFRTLGCYGGKIVKTPNIDFLAAGGAMCTKFYATTPVCSPSRAAFVSGRYPHNTPVVTNNIPMSDEIETFAEILRGTGYATGYAGKWHLDGTGKPQWAPQRKFGFEDNRYMFNRGHWKKMEDTPAGPRVAARDRKGKPGYAVADADEKSFTTDWLASRAIDFVNAHRNVPFCYMVSIPDPHGPNTVRPPYNTMFDSEQAPVPSTFHKSAEQIPGWAPPEKGLTEKRLKKLMPPYYGMVKCIDDNVGRILTALRKNGIMDRTIVVFTSDHGDLCGEHKRLNKGVPYEGSAKIPFIMYFPKKIKGGTVVKQVLTCVDFLPTILSLMDVTKPPWAEGRDASGLFVIKRLLPWKDIGFMRGTHDWLCAMTQNHKIVYSQKDVPWLFDLKEDPDELTNFFKDPQYRDVVKNLTAELIAYCKRYDDPRLEDRKMGPEMKNAAG